MQNTIDQEIESIRHTLSQIADDHQNMLLFKLSLAHEKRFNLLGQPDDINQAVECAAVGVAITPDDSPEIPLLLGTLGRFHSSRFEFLGDMSDLEKAIEFQTRGLLLTPQSDPELPSHLTNLAVSHKIRYEHTDEPADLERAIEYENRAIAEAPNDLAHISGRMSNLGVSYQLRFLRLGELANLEKAIEAQSTALSFTPEDHPDLTIILSSLGVSHKLRYEHLGELADLEKAIKHESRALDLTPDSQRYKSTRLANLSVSYVYQFQRTKEITDLDKAIQLLSRSLELTPHGHPYLPTRLQNLGGHYTYRFERLGELADLEKAIVCLSRSLTLTPDGHPNIHMLLHNLAASHRDRFERLGEPSDLEKAFKYIKHALHLLPDGHPALPMRHNALADLHFISFQHTTDVSHLQHSLQSFRMASQPPSGPPRDRFRYAYHWATLAFDHNTLNPIEAYQTSIDLLPQFIWLGATTAQRYEDLKTAETLAVEAASVAIRSSAYELAVEWLEHARCVVWNQSLMLRSPLDRLHSVAPELSSRLQQIADQLDRASSKSRDNRTPASSLKTLAEEQVAQNHRRLAKEYNDLLSQVRKLPGLEDFLQPMKAKNLVRAARNGPIVVINCHQDRCDALVLFPGEEFVDHVALPNWSGEKARRARLNIETSLRRKGIRERGVKRVNEPELEDVFRRVLAELWYDIVQPVLEHLGCMNHAPMDDLPHITWCPTGPLSFLPLHAAGDYDQPRQRVFNYVISSYTPTLTALLASASNSLDSDREPRILTVGQANTPGHSPLPGTTQELAHVKAHVQGAVGYTQLINHQATTISVLDAMEQHDWVHFACHAHQNVADPTKSGFFLHEGTLDLASINRRSFKNKGLAFLSACQTATGDEALPDEAIHLASGMLMAGYPSVIATMWSVSDEIAPLVADKVYQRLLKDRKMGNGEAGRALHHAIAEVREKVGEKEFGYWVPYIHIGS